MKVLTADSVTVPVPVLASDPGPAREAATVPDWRAKRSARTVPSVTVPPVSEANVVFAGITSLNV